MCHALLSAVLGNNTAERSQCPRPPLSPAISRTQGRAQLLPPPASGWGWQEDLWQAGLAAFPGSASAEAHVLAQLLVPGQLCRAALQGALAAQGAHVALEQMAGMGARELKVGSCGCGCSGLLPGF